MDMVNAMSTVFPFVEVPKELLVVVGEQVPGTRIYRKIGSEEEDGYWFEVLDKKFGPLVWATTNPLPA